MFDSFNRRIPYSGMSLFITYKNLRLILPDIADSTAQHFCGVFFVETFAAANTEYSDVER